MSARLLSLGFALLAAAFPAARAGEACPPFRELRPARVARDRSVLIFTRSVDPAWFDCARRAGGKVSGRSEVERGGAWDVDSQSGRLGADLRLDAWASNYCGRSGKSDPARVRFVVEATGPLAPLGATTEPLPALCGCTVYPTTELQLTPSPAGLSLRGKLTAPHLACLWHRCRKSSQNCAVIATIGDLPRHVGCAGTSARGRARAGRRAVE